MSHPHYTYITGYNDPIALNAPARNGQVIIIFNEAGETITIDSDINVQGAATDQILLTSASWVELLYINSEDTTERFRDIGGSAVGVTLQ